SVCVLCYLPSTPPSLLYTLSLHDALPISAVVLLLTTPIAISSAIRPEITSAVVSPGTATISMPTEQTAVIASNFSIESTPALTRSEEHTSELQSRFDLVCRLMLETTKKTK